MTNGRQADKESTMAQEISAAIFEDSIGRLAENRSRPTGACLRRVVFWTNHLLGPEEFVELRIGQKAQLAVGFT